MQMIEEVQYMRAVGGGVRFIFGIVLWKDS